MILAKLPSAQRGSEPVIIALGEKVFGALLAIAGAAIILTSHWATTDDMIAGPDRRSVDAGVWSYGLTDVELSALTAALVRRGDRRLLHRTRRERFGIVAALRKLGPGTALSSFTLKI